MQQAPGLRLPSIHSFPLGDGNFSSPVPAAESRKSILKHSCLMIEEMLVLSAFRANLKSKFALLKCPIRHWLLAWEWSSGGPSEAASRDCTRDLDTRCRRRGVTRSADLLSSRDAEDDAYGKADRVCDAADRAEAEVFQLRPQHESLAAVEDQVGASSCAKCIGIGCAGIVRR